MHYISDNDVFAVWTQLKDKYPLKMTTAKALDERATVDCPVLVGKANGQIIELYSDGDMFVLDVMDELKTKGTHWHPNDVEAAVDEITKFMDGKSDYTLYPFKQQ